MQEFSLINVNGLSDVACRLIDRVSEAIGAIGRPYQLVRMAKAEAEADLIRTEGEIAADALRSRAFARFEAEECKRQLNLESVLKLASEMVGPDAAPEKVELDWIVNWTMHCRIVTDAEMQTLWAAVLAREADRRGSFSRRTVNLLNDLDRDDALLFRELCRFVWNAGEPMPIILDANQNIYQSQGITFGSLQHLESLGLIHFHVLGLTHSTDDYSEVSYCGRSLPLAKREGQHMEFNVGKTMFSNAGLELYRLVDQIPVDGFFEFCQQFWARAGFVESARVPG